MNNFIKTKVTNSKLVSKKVNSLILKPQECLKRIQVKSSQVALNKNEYSELHEFLQARKK